MGKKSAPAPFIQPAEETTEAVDRKELDRITRRKIESAKKASASVKDGEKAPQASLLAERDYWDKKESLLKG
jgi:hypothetical protein